MPLGGANSPPASAGHVAKPSSTIASSVRISAVSLRKSCSGRSKWTMLTRPWPGPRNRCSFPYRRCNQSPLGQRVCTLADGGGPSLLPGPGEHCSCGEKGSWRAPQQLVGFVVDVVADPLEQRVGQLSTRRQAPRDEQEPCLAEQQ